MAELIKNRYDFVLLFDVTDGNPNGDPDAGNLPRVDAETGMGIVTDVCLKRKVRNFVQMVKGNEKPYDIFIKERSVLNTMIDESHEQEEVKTVEKKADKTEAARQWMCSNYFDIRTFGAVLSTGKNAGQVRGPVQLTFGRSVDPVVALEHTITRVAKTTEDRAETGGSEMGRKFTVPYGLYRAHGFVSAHLAAQTGFHTDDLDLLWESLKLMFDHDHSAARGMMNTRKLIVFKHSSALGNAPAHELFDRVCISKKETNKPARLYQDYEVKIDKDGLPQGVEILEVV